MPKPTQTFELIDRRITPKTKRLIDYLKDAGFKNVRQRYRPTGISLTIQDKTYDIEFGEWVTTNLDPGINFVFTHRMPHASEYYALAA